MLKSEAYQLIKRQEKKEQARTYAPNVNISQVKKSEVSWTVGPLVGWSVCRSVTRFSLGRSVDQSVWPFESRSTVLSSSYTHLSL